LTGRTARRRVLRVSLPHEAGLTAQASPRADLLAAEEPLGIRVNGEAITLTMRTPGDDIDLAAGFLVGEGVLRSASDVAQIKICTGDRCGHGDHEGMGNIADVTLGPGAMVPVGLRRNFLTTSACGVCGKASIADICQLPATGLAADQVTVEPLVLTQLPGQLREAQRVFSATGGLHAAGLFTADGELLAIREDVGRHNAVDKVVGCRWPGASCWSAAAHRSSWCKRR
jgi:FdhD protein